MPMMEAVAHYLSIIYEQQEEARSFLGDAYVESDYLITDEFGKPLSLARIDRRFKRTLIEHGMRPIRFHDLRHPYVKPALNFFKILDSVDKRHMI